MMQHASNNNPINIVISRGTCLNKSDHRAKRMTSKNYMRKGSVASEPFAQILHNFVNHKGAAIHGNSHDRKVWMRALACANTIHIKSAIASRIGGLNIGVGNAPYGWEIPIDATIGTSSQQDLDSVAGTRSWITQL